MKTREEIQGFKREKKGVLGNPSLAVTALKCKTFSKPVHDRTSQLNVVLFTITYIRWGFTICHAKCFKYIISSNYLDELELSKYCHLNYQNKNRVKLKTFQPGISREAKKICSSLFKKFAGILIVWDILLVLTTQWQPKTIFLSSWILQSISKRH